MNWQGARVLVAGGAGLVGSNLIKRLLPIGASIRATYHDKDPDLSLWDLEEIDWRDSDLTDVSDCERVVKDMDYVFMCASVKGGAGTMEKDTLSLFTPNILIYLHMLEAAYRVGVKKLLFLGSSTAYPDSDQPVKEEQMFEGDPWDKYFLVGWHKRFGEKFCQIFSEKVPRPVPCVVLRPTNIYGPYDNFNPESSHVTAALIRKVVEKQDPLEVWGDGNDVRDLIYVDDIIDAMFLAIEKIEGYDPINIGVGTGVSVKQILDIILQVADHHPKVIFNSAKPTMIPKRLVSTEKAQRLLGWTPKTSIYEGIKRTLEWYKAHA